MSFSVLGPFKSDNHLWRLLCSCEKKAVFTEDNRNRFVIILENIERFWKKLFIQLFKKRLKQVTKADNYF